MTDAIRPARVKAASPTTSPISRARLRAAGLPVGPGAVLDAIEAVEAARIGTREDFYWTLHAVFVKRHEHSILFDQAFRIFWRRRALIEKLHRADVADRARRRQGGEEAAGRRPARRRGLGHAPAGEAGAGREDRVLRPPHRLRARGSEGARISRRCRPPRSPGPSG